MLHFVLDDGITDKSTVNNTNQSNGKLDIEVELQIEEQNNEFYTVLKKLETLSNDDRNTILAIKNQFIPKKDTEVQLSNKLFFMIFVTYFNVCK